MNLFNLILMVNVIILTTELIQNIKGKCIMRAACSSHRELSPYEDPTSTKWYNCRYDGEPIPLSSQEAVDNFKTLCPSMYTHDNQPLCCNSEQLAILKKDLLTARALIGSCSSCFFNFRILWCQFACNPNQADFLIPTNVTKTHWANFTQHLDNFRKIQSDKDSDDYDYEEYDYENESYDNNDQDYEKNLSYDDDNKVDQSYDNNNDGDQSYDNNNDQSYDSSYPSYYNDDNENEKQNKIGKIEDTNSELNHKKIHEKDAQEQHEQMVSSNISNNTINELDVNTNKPVNKIDSYDSISNDEYDNNYDDFQEVPRKIKRNVRRKIRRIKRSVVSETSDTHKVDSVVRADMFIDKSFMNRFVDSCRDIKIYGDYALQGLCGLPANLCNGKEIGDYLGLKVDMRPMNIQFHLVDEEKLRYTAHDPIETNKLITYDLKTIKPELHMCNESYQYGDLEYGAKCSCKDCKASCNLYVDLRLHKKQVFMIGEIDGVSFIMFLIWLLFLVPFLHVISFYKNIRRKLFNKNKSALNCTVYGNQNQTSSSKSGPNEELENNLISAYQNNFTMSPLSAEEFEIENQKKKELNFLDRMTYVGELLEMFIGKNFTRMGRFCATYPGLVLFIGILFSGILCLGYVNFTIENDPIKLWSADSSMARQNKKYFDEKFSPFYRITQLIIEPKVAVKLTNHNNEERNITSLSAQLLNETLSLYMNIYKLTAKCTDCEEKKNSKITIEDICYQPLKPEKKKCAIQSVFQYWQNDEEHIRESLKTNSYLYYLENCMTNPFNPDCLGDFGGPLQPYMVAGSYDNQNFLEAKALVFTFVIDNYVKSKNPEKIKKAMAWESEVLKLLRDYSSSLIDVSYTTERSIEDELERESKADMKIIGISYIVMFFYLTFTLGKYSSMNIRMCLIEMKFFLALGGVILVMLSVLSSGGFFTYIGVPATLITLEVIPFLLLAVGVDNIYVMVQTYQNDERSPSECVEDQIARIVGKVGPSMLLTGTTQSAAFLISSMTPMPGVRAFSLYASLAIVLNFILQITCFVALLSLDAKREKAKRVDMLCCIKCRNLDNSEISSGKKSFLHIWFKEIYTPFLLNNCVRGFVIISFVGFFFACIAMCDKIKIGLDQRLTMSQDSYQNKYFGAIQEHLKVGPPVYFVLKDGFNYSDVNSLRKLCGASNCDSDSLQSIIASASFFANETYISQPTVNWIDDYMEWLNSEPSADTSSTCCYINTENDQFCDVKALRSYEIPKTKKEKEFLANCKSCPVTRTSYKFPTNDVFLKHIESYLKQNPSSTCIKAGHAMYGDAVNLKRHEDSNEVTGIGSSHFMAYHKVLSTSDDFINAMVSANQVSEKITKMLNNGTNTNYEVIPYSIFYVFYEQYVKIWQDATAQLVTTLIAIFLCTFILLSFDLFTSLIVTTVVAIIIIDMVGIMFLWNIELNAISLVNLVIAIGISVEFSAHIARAFATSNGKTKKKRASDALCNMGPPVFCGGFQSIVGISVLAFAHSQLFQVFYFRMYFSILLLGLSHGLIFLPVLLSYIGTNERMISHKGRSSSHLHYFKVNFDKNSSTESYDNTQEMTNRISLNESQFNNNKKTIAASPSSLIKTKDRKYYAKMNKNERENGSPTSRKSIDLLLNEHNDNNSNSSDNNYDKETSNNKSFEVKDSESEFTKSEHSRGSFATKLNSLRGKFIESHISRSRLSSKNDYSYNGNDKSVTDLNFSPVDRDENESYQNNRNVPEILGVLTPSTASLEKNNLDKNNNTINSKILSQSFNLKSSQKQETVQSNKSLTNLIVNKSNEVLK